MSPLSVTATGGFPFAVTKTKTSATPATPADNRFSPNQPIEAYPTPTTTPPRAYPPLTLREYAFTPLRVCDFVLARCRMYMRAATSGEDIPATSRMARSAPGLVASAVRVKSTTSPRSVAAKVSLAPRPSPIAPTAKLPSAAPAYCAVVMAPVHVATSVGLRPASAHQ